VYANEICKIGTASFLGDAVIDFVPGANPNRGEPIPDRASISRENVAVDRNPVELLDVALNLESQVKDTLDSFKRASDTVSNAGASVSKLSDTIQDAIGNQDSDFKQFMNNTNKLAGKAETAIDNFNELMVNINEFAGDPEMRQSTRESFRRLPELLDEINATVTDTRDTINSFRKVGSNAEENLANLTEFTRALGENGPEIIDSLNKSLSRVDGLMNDITSLTEGMGKGNGTLSKFLNDPELYNNLNDAVRNIRDVTVQLEPLMNDVRFAVDGIARDPGQLGLRGSFDRRPAFSGPKGNPPATNLLESFQNGW
jgi:phospholipid/cholesterol/gamma-HCH transport system substrate-binding protein